MVDSHARNAAGMADARGKSVVVYLSSIKKVHKCICNLSKTLTRGRKPFEISGVTVKHKGSNDDIITLSTGSLENQIEQACLLNQLSNNNRQSKMKRKKPIHIIPTNKRKRSDCNSDNADIIFCGEVQHVFSALSYT